MDQSAFAKLKPFIKRIQNAFKPVRVILFGSRARGTALETSDYDLLIISPAFRRIPFYERHVRAYHLQREPLSIDLICLTPEEYETQSQQLSMIKTAAQEGIELAS